MISRQVLEGYNTKRMSEAEIASELGVSRYTLYRWRRKLGVLDIGRSDRGVDRVDPVERRDRRNAYMREYMKKKEIVGSGVVIRCYVCGGGIKLGEEGLAGNGHCICTDCLGRFR